MEGAQVQPLTPTPVKHFGPLNAGGGGGLLGSKAAAEHPPWAYPCTPKSPPTANTSASAATAMEKEQQWLEGNLVALF